jgi:hypothetical protein
MSSHRRTRSPRRGRLLRSGALLVGVVLLTAGLLASNSTALNRETAVGDSRIATPSASASTVLPADHGVRRHPARDTPAPTPKAPSAATSTTRCDGAPDTPGGRDPWGGCWPGPSNTGVPAGIALMSYTGPCEIRANNVVIDGRTVNCAIDLLGSNLTIKNSMINGEVLNNGHGAVVIKDTVINGGSDQSETVGGNNITILGSNLHGNQHEVYCGDNCVVENSWLHDNYNGAALGWHQNGFLSTGGTNYTLEHNSVYCVGGCTADITFIPNDNISHAVIARNLLVATASAAYCLYPSSDHPAKPGVFSQIAVTDNIFQGGPNGKCAYYGAVYGWDAPNNSPGTDGYGNVWSGNKWNSGAALDP